jgi:hypothetical protein
MGMGRMTTISITTTGRRRIPTTATRRDTHVACTRSGAAADRAATLALRKLDTSPSSRSIARFFA